MTAVEEDKVHMSLLTVLGAIFIVWGMYTIKSGTASYNSSLLSFQKNVVYTRKDNPFYFWISVLIRFLAGIMIIYIDN